VGGKIARGCEFSRDGVGVVILMLWALVKKIIESCPTLNVELGLANIVNFDFKWGGDEF